MRTLQRDSLEVVMKWIAAITGAIVGYQVGFYAVGSGVHGGEAWPTLLFCGPVWMFAAALGDNMGYVRAMMLGTAVLYAIYGWCLVNFRSWRTVLTIAMMHVPFALLSLAY